MGRAAAARKCGAAAALALTLSAAAALAETADAVGRLVQVSAKGKETPAYCTGTLVAPRLVLTAGHCLASLQETPDRIVFEAGYVNGRMAGRARGEKILLAEAAVPKDWSRDVGLLVLDQPISVTPLAVGAQIRPSMLLRVYFRDRPEHPVTLPICHLLQHRQDLLLLGCNVVSGNSGGPVLVRDKGVWQVAAILVARAGDNAIALRVPPDILALITQARAEDKP